MFVHGRHTVVKVGTDDLSEFANATTFNRSGDANENTTYGKNSKSYNGGLKDSKITLEGVYDDGVDGPGAILRPLLATSTTFTFQPEGTGTGKPQSVVDVVITAYNESSPVADNIKWTCEMQGSDDIADTAQV